MFKHFTYFLSLLKKELKYKIVNYIKFNSVNDNIIDEKIIKSFCAVFGSKYKNILTLSTNMDDIEEWDSLSFIDFVTTLEKEYLIEFTNDEAAQMFQIGHIQRIINQAKLNIPHDDVGNCYALSYLIKKDKKDDFKFVTLSTSSTREALLSPLECNSILKENMNVECGWYNMSVSGLILAEQLQILESIGGKWKSYIF